MSNNNKYCRFEKQSVDMLTGKVVAIERHLLHKNDHTFMRIGTSDKAEWIKETKPEELKVLLLLGMFLANGTNIVHYSSLTKGALAKCCKLDPRTLRLRIKNLEDANRLLRVDAGLIYVNPTCLSTLASNKMLATQQEYDKIREEIWSKKQKI